MTESFFSSSWAEARERFRAATAGLPHGAIPVPGPSPNGVPSGSPLESDLSIDWAFRGDPEAPDLLLVTSGLHGVEGFPGSAVQLAMLKQPVRAATLFVHVLNPWGMASLRRVNANNVDLNRNVRAPVEIYRGATDGYRELNALLNPATPPGIDFFWLRAGGVLLRKGFQALKSAVACGQYDYPKGLFYGGDGPQPEHRALLGFLDKQLAGRRRVVHLDLHSAIGERGGRTLLLDARKGSDEITGSQESAAVQAQRVRAAFGEVRTWDASDASAYPIRGGLTSELQRRYPEVRYDGLTCEFGTVSTLAVLGALREENRLQHHGRPTLEAPEKAGMRAAFAPIDSVWEEKVVAHAAPLYDAATLLVATA